MKSLEEKRDELAISYVKHCQDNMHAVYGIAEAYCKADFKAGWDACAKEYEQENTKLKRQLEIVKEALQFYAEFTGEFKPYNTSQDFIINWGHTAQEALKDLESAGE